MSDDVLGKLFEHLNDSAPQADLAAELASIMDAVPEYGGADLARRLREFKDDPAQLQAVLLEVDEHTRQIFLR